MDVGPIDSLASALNFSDRSVDNEHWFAHPENEVFPRTPGAVRSLRAKDGQG